MADSTRDAERGSAGRPRSGGERAGRRERRQARKERVLHTRISDDLAEDIRRMAEDLRVPVSNIVRTVLEEAFSVVEKVTDNVGDLIDEVVDEAEAARERIRRRHRARREAREQAPRTGWEDEDEAAAMRDAESAAVAYGGARAAEVEPVDVIGWQPLILAGPRHCGVCDAAIAAGTQGWASVTPSGIGASIRCERCLRDLQPAGDDR